MTDFNKQDDLDKTIDDIISDLPLNEKVLIAYMDFDDVSILQNVFDFFIRDKMDIKNDEIIVKLWERLQQTHRMRSVK